MKSPRKSGITLCIAFALLALTCAESALAVEPALFSTIEDGNVGALMPSPDVGLPNPAQTPFNLPIGAVPHGVSFRGGGEALFAEFAAPLLYRASLTTPGTVESISLTGRSNGNGSLAASPDGRFVLSIGESVPGGAAEAVVIDFGSGVPVVTPIVSALRVKSFATAAIDFARDGRAFVCHSTGVSVLNPPYTTIAFTMAFPTIVQSASMCRLTRDGSRLFVTRVLSETVASVNAVRTTTAPFSASSVFVAMPTPAGVQGLGPMAVSPDGQALIVGQQFLFPPAFAGTKARAFLLRAPFDAQTAYQEMVLPATTTGINCTAEGNARDCPGFEHIEVSDDGSLAVLTGNSSSVVPNVPDRVPAVFLQSPFNDATRTALAVQIAPAAPVPGRGSGAVRFRPTYIFADGLETP